MPARTQIPPSEGDEQTTTIDLEDADSELGQIEAPLAEASCGSTAADRVVPPPGVSTSSDNANYDHSTCRSAFIVDLPGAAEGTRVAAGNSFGAFSFFGLIPCSTNRAYLAVWQKQGASYVKIAETTANGQTTSGGTPRVGPLGPGCTAYAVANLPAAGDYKLVTQAAGFLGAKTVVRVNIQRP